jgi:hypothetical protein
LRLNVHNVHLGVHTLMGMGTVCMERLPFSAELKVKLEEQVGKNEGGPD